MTTDLHAPINPSICPLCGNPNQCAMAADPNAKDCWCGDRKIPQELLDRIPEPAVRKACICVHCLEKFLAETDLTGLDQRPSD